MLGEHEPCDKRGFPFVRYSGHWEKLSGKRMTREGWAAELIHGKMADVMPSPKKGVLMHPSKTAVKTVFLIGILSVIFFSTAAAEKSNEAFDFLFVNGRVLDGTGNPWFYADVAIKNGRIAAVGRLKDRVEAASVIDIQGKILCPGFIDIHCHAFDRVADETVWTGEDEQRYFAPNFVSQGVTALVSNQCGNSPLDIKRQRETLNSRGTGPNVMLLIGHNDVRRHIMKDDFRRPATADETLAMRAIIRQAMKDGAGGLSSGLEYVPAIWATKEEVTALVEEIVPFQGVFIAHERAAGLTPMWYVPSQDAPGPPNMLDNIRDLIEVSERTGAAVVATHIKARGADFWGGSRAIIHLIERARARGINIWADGYPYNSSGSDGSAVLIPRWALGESYQATLLQVLNDPGKKSNLYRDIAHNLNWRGGAENIMVMDFPDKSFIGKTLARLAEEQGRSDVEMVLALQLEGDPDRAGGGRLRCFSMSEIDVEAFAAQTWCATSSDARIALPGDGPVHARFYGTFPRKIRHYALERRVISLEHAVRSSTSLPAQILGLRDRGQIREGLAADIVVFDLETIQDTATFFEPHQYAEGIFYVMVNGTLVVANGELTWKRPGRVITR
jgi:N-acyl-D-amino-acid deacylase